MTLYNTTEPSTNDDLGTTLRKILQVVNNGGVGGSSLFVTPPPVSSASPGVPGNYSYGNGNFYWYDGASSRWLAIAGTTF